MNLGADSLSLQVPASDPFMLQKLLALWSQGKQCVGVGTLLHLTALLSSSESQDKRCLPLFALSHTELLRQSKVVDIS